MPVIKSQNGEVINPLSEEVTDPRITGFFGANNTEFWALDTITYGSVSEVLAPFLLGINTHSDGTQEIPFAFEETHLAQTGDLLDKISRFIDLSFEATEGAEVPLIALGFSTVNFGAGAATFPKVGRSIVEGVVVEYGGSVTIFYDELAATPAFNPVYYKVLMHEIGHILGLDHPHTGSGESFVSRLPANYAGHDMTIMSSGYTLDFSSRFEGYYLAHDVTNWLLTDILALQAIYGVDQTVTVGNDKYTYSEGETYYEVLWDTSGIDEIIIDSTQNTEIDLSKEGWINVGSSVQYLSRNGAEPLTVNETVYLMEGVVIEKLTGGSGRDIFTGNASANILIGNDGNDQLNGNDGDDVLRGGAGNDELFGGNGNDALWAGGDDNGNDTMNGGSGKDTLGGGAGNDNLIGGTGSDVIFGGVGNDTIWTNTQNDTSNTQNDQAWSGDGDDIIHAAAGNDELGGGTGDDTINGGGGNDIIFGGRGDANDVGTNDSINGGDGDDTVFGSGGNDNIEGGDGNDLLFNGGGNDTVNGGADTDTLWGGGGNDILTGGEGADTFAFASDNGNDTITDFDLTADILDLSEIDLTSLAEVEALASNTANGLLITISDTQSILIENVSLDDFENIQFIL